LWEAKGELPDESWPRSSYSVDCFAQLPFGTKS